MPETTTVQSRIAGLAGDNTQVISGVAVGAGDITRGLSGDKKVWQAAELRDAAQSLEGTPVNPLHSEQTVGEVVRAGYEPGAGVIYEAELSDESLAEQAASGGLEVSIEARHADGGTVETDRGEAMAATNIRFTGLSLVQRGAAPSASAEPGEAAALSPAAIHESLANATLAEVNGIEVDLSPPEAVVNAAQAALDAKEEYDTLSDCGTGVGETRAEQIVSGDLSPEDFTSGGAAETAIPDYLNSHSEDVNGIDEPPTQWGEATWTDGCGPVQYALWGGTATGTGLEWAQSTADAVGAAMENAEMGYNTDETANMAEVPDEYVFSNPGEAVSKAQEMGLEGASDEIIHTHGEGDDTVFMPAPSHDDLMEMLREMGALAASAAFSEGDLVRWSTSASPGTGRVAEVVTEAGETVSANGADVTREATEDEAAYKLDDYVGPEAGYDEGVVVKSASEMLGEWDDAPEEARMAAATTDDPETGEVAGGEPESRTDEQTAELNTHMSDTEEELRARLSEKDDELAKLQNEVEQLKDEREDVARAYAEALAAGDTILSEDELVDKFEVAELRAKVENTESATLADTEPSVQSGGGESDTETASLSEAEQAEVAEHRDVIADLAGKSGVAEHERQRRAELVAEKTGEDPDTILEQEN
jgi:hypothetical protein